MTSSVSRPRTEPARVNFAPPPPADAARALPAPPGAARAPPPVCWLRTKDVAGGLVFWTAVLVSPERNIMVRRSSSGVPCTTRDRSRPRRRGPEGFRSRFECRQAPDSCLPRRQPCTSQARSNHHQPKFGSKGALEVVALLHFLLHAASEAKQTRAHVLGGYGGRLSPLSPAVCC